MARNGRRHPGVEAVPVGADQLCKAGDHRGLREQRRTPRGGLIRKRPLFRPRLQGRRRLQADKTRVGSLREGLRHRYTVREREGRDCGVSGETGGTCRKANIPTAAPSRSGACSSS